MLINMSKQFNIIAKIENYKVSKKILDFHIFNRC